MLAVAAVSSTRDGIYTGGESQDTLQEMREMFAYPLSDHMTDSDFFMAYLTATSDKAETQISPEDWCLYYGINPTAMEEAEVLYNLLQNYYLGKFKGTNETISSLAVSDPGHDYKMRKSLAKGLFFTSAVQDTERAHVYWSINNDTSGNTSPDSVLNELHPDWIVYSKYVKRQQPYLVRLPVAYPQYDLKMRKSLAKVVFFTSVMRDQESTCLLNYQLRY